jgi:hypothetical protein
MTSKYAIALYELVQLRGNLDRCTEQFTLARFRSLLGVPPGAYERGNDFIKRVIELACIELNGLSEFGVRITVERAYSRVPTRAFNFAGGAKGGRNSGKRIASGNGRRSVTWQVYATGLTLFCAFLSRRLVAPSDAARTPRWICCSGSYPPFAMLLNGSVHRVWSEVQFARPHDRSQLDIDLVKQSKVPQARENTRLRRGNQRGEIDRTC